MNSKMISNQRIISKTNEQMNKRINRKRMENTKRQL